MQYLVNEKKWEFSDAELIVGRRELCRLQDNAANHAYKITVNVYRGTFGDCTNEGESSVFDRFTLYAPHISLLAAYIDMKENWLNPAACLRVGQTFFGDKEFRHALPLTPDRFGKVRMFGGNFVYSSDSRFAEVSGLDYPLPVHDRIEE